MPRPKSVIFTVRGNYGFPFDMLRYDCAYPTDKGVSGLSRITSGENREVCATCNGTAQRPPQEGDIQGVEYRCDACRGTGLGRLLAVDIELTAALGRVTDDRWRSFGWIVVDQRPGYY